MLIWKLFEEVMEWTTNIEERILSGFAQIGLFILIMGFAFWFLLGFLAPLAGGEFRWIFRTVLVGVWLLSELAYKIGE